MFKSLGQVIIYVKDQEIAKNFWLEKAGFHLVSELEFGPGMKAIEIAPQKDVPTTLVLHNKDIIAKMQPELNLGTPSLMFYCENLEGLYEKLKNSGVTVGDLVTMPTARVFNFSDDEGNYFAVREK